MRSNGFISNLFWIAVVLTAPLLSSLEISYSVPKHKEQISFQFDERWAEDQLKNLTLEEKIGQFFMVAAYSNQGERHLGDIEKLVTNEKIGGIIFFQGERANLKEAVSRFQAVAKTPLLIGMDAEWGVQMRLFNEERFPYAYTLGAADDVVLSERIAAMMAQECRDLGIHINFAPVADVNSNPKNPVIGFRSFGENPKKVADHVKAFVRGMENNGVMTSIKHFPGHGNTDKDSHLELPTVSQTLKSIEAIDMLPFIEGIREGSSSVMVGHLNVPALDNSNTPTSLSRKVIKDYLQGTLGFKGLVISDALNMKAVADRYGKEEVVVKAFEAGCDILLFPENVTDAIRLIKKKVDQGSISLAEIDARCLKILKAKQKFLPDPKNKKKFTPGEMQLTKNQVYEKAITVLKNQDDLLPLGRLDRKIARVSVGMHTFEFREAIDLFADIDHFHYFTPEEAQADFSKIKSKYDVVIVAIHANTVRPKNNFGFGNKVNDFLNSFSSSQNNILVVFGNPLLLQKDIDLSKFKSVILAYENYYLTQDRTAQLLFGAIPAMGKLPFTINETFSREKGVEIAWGGRLKFSQPEELGIDPEKLKEIDEIALNGVKKGAYPGCQVVVAVEGKIIYRKSFGTHQYNTNDSVSDLDVYDIASVSKIAGSTAGVMHLQSQGKFSLSNKLEDYIPETTGSGAFGNILIRDMMAHQAGLTAWIPFYKRSLKNGVPDPSIYVSEKRSGFSKEVAKDLWIRDDYTDTIYKQILASGLGPKNYEYSDLGYYFIKKIVEKQTNSSFQDFLEKELYIPMGLRSLCFRPHERFSLKRIVPTEKDMAFRKQLVHGYVHDPGAAMLGGVGGHAGLFANATDLASLMQVFLNKGTYGNVRYMNEEVVDEYTRAQFPGNRRGAGFDRPKASGGGTCHEYASQKSYGHSGFTGTLAWADPEYGINYIFLSNRVCPDQDNWKLRDMNIRTEIQRVIYEAVKAAKK